LDCDIIVLDDLGSLFEQDLDDYSTAMVLDASMKLPSTDNQKRLGIPQDGNYFNTGVALVNLKKWREKNAEEVLFKWTRKNREKIMWVDQDAINVVFHDSIKKWAEKYNLKMHHYTR
jgi:lipopolysaccharide biosynthesis glycosyltransferase